METDEDMKNRVTDLSRGLAEVKKHNEENLIQFVHQSVKDYLVQGTLRKYRNSQCHWSNTSLSLMVMYLVYRNGRDQFGSE